MNINITTNENNDTFAIQTGELHIPSCSADYVATVIRYNALRRNANVQWAAGALSRFVQQNTGVIRQGTVSDASRNHN